MASDDRSRRPNDPANGGDASSSSDFGSFVSSSVRDSFRKLKPETPTTPTGTQPTAEPAPRRSRRRSTPDQTSGDTSRESSPQLGTPVGRKWRDTLPGAISRNRSTSDQPFEGEASAGDSTDSGDEPATDGAGFDFRGWFLATFWDEDGPNRKFWGLVAAAIIIILIVIYLLLQGQDNNGGEETPTPTSTTVISTDHTATPSRIVRPSATKNATVVVHPPEETPEPSPTPPVIEGGDNTRG